MHSTKTGTTGLIAEDTASVVGVVVGVVGVVGVKGVTSLPATNTLRIFLSSPNEGSNKNINQNNIMTIYSQWTGLVDIFW